VGFVKTQRGTIQRLHGPTGLCSRHQTPEAGCTICYPRQASKLDEPVRRQLDYNEESEQVEEKDE